MKTIASIQNEINSKAYELAKADIIQFANDIHNSLLGKYKELFRDYSISNNDNKTGRDLVHNLTFINYTESEFFQRKDVMCILFTNCFNEHCERLTKEFLERVNSLSV